MDGRCIGRSAQHMAERSVGKHFRDFRQDFEMLLRHMGGDEQENQQTDWLTIGRLKWNRFFQAYERRQRRFQSLDAAMGDSDAMPEAGRSQAFARKQIVRHSRAGDAAIVFENQSGLFESAFLARYIEVENDICVREDFAEMVHDAAHKKGIFVEL